MDALVHADIFFFVSTIALVVLSIALLVALYYVIAVVRDVRKISARMERASVTLEKDFDELRENVKAEGRKVRGMADVILGFALRAISPKPKKRKKLIEVEVDEETETE
jgi:hypothetical protein